MVLDVRRLEGLKPGITSNERLSGYIYIRLSVQMLVAPARLLGLGLIIIRRAVVSLIWGPQFPRWNSSGILLKKATMGF